MTKFSIKTKREDLLAEVNRLQALQEKEDGWALIAEGFKKVFKKAKEEMPLIKRDFLKFYESCKETYKTIKSANYSIFK